MDSTPKAAPEEEIDLRALGREIAVRMDPQALLDAEDAAAFLKFSRDYFIKEVSKAPSFPKPVHLHGPGGRRAQPRWQRCDIVEWVEAHKPKENRRPGRPRQLPA